MEIVAAVGEALLSASVQSLIERLISDELDIFVRQEKIDADIKDWKMILAEINALLDNAEDTQMTDPTVKIWLDEFRDLTYDIEDVLDEFNTEAMKRDMMEDPQASTSKLPNFLSTCFSCFSTCFSCFTSSVFKKKMASRIKDITGRLQRIKTREEHTLNLRTFAKGTTSKQLKQRLQTTALEGDSHISGRNDEKNDIVRKLLRDDGSNKPISMIPILGMGGIGKTTLAQLVYNDPAVQEYFDIKVWVCVSENFDVEGLTRTILWKVAPETRDLRDPDLDSLQQRLKGKLSKKKFLLILDDVWEEKFHKWEDLRKPFISAASNSKIIVTTRKENAAPIMGDVHVYRVKELSDDECLCLLAFHALGAANSFDARPDLKVIGEKLVERCNGLPLAAKLLGGLLCNKGELEQWERVLRNNKWETSNSVHPTLKLSYDDLPSHLKRCFVYCAIFPKDYAFDRDELVRLWMAEGFLQHRQGRKTMEDLGIEYFVDLVSRSFFQWSSSKKSNEISTSGSLYEPTNSVSKPNFVMHDLISDLAQTIAGDICYNYENKTEVDMPSSQYEKVRHASFPFGQDSQEYEVYSRMKRLRTIWRTGDSYADMEVYGNKMMEELSTHSKCVRVLSLPNCSITKLSNSIGDLIHLRYINLSDTNIRQLPESVSTLLNLQTLLLCDCGMLEKLPDKIGNLANLLHLDISYTDKLQKLPSGVGMLTNLQTLSKFIVKEGGETTIAALKNLNNLRGSLSIQGLQNVEDAKSANLKGKQGLEELNLAWDYCYGRSGWNDMSVLESLEPPHQNLKRLTISSYGGAEFPSWMTNNNLFSMLVSLNLRDCGQTEVLPPLGQLCLLKELRIYGLKAVKTIGVEFYGNVDVPFPSLKRLEISDMSEWIEWSHGNKGGEGFPNLQRLRIYDCPKLIRSLPSGLHRLQHLSQLEIIQCENLVFPRMGLPLCLKRIYVRCCCAFKCFPIIDTRDGRESLLEELEIEYCSSLKHFERNFKLPTSLRKLTIWNCGNLLSVPDRLMVQDDNTNQSHLEYLTIVGCKRLTSLPTGKFPAALKTLGIGGSICMQLESAISAKNTALERIKIWNGANIKALSFIDCLPSLRSLSISYCRALKSFPEMGFFSTTLQNLEIIECRNLSLVPIRMHFPSLRMLSICRNMRQPMAEWGLGMLSSLERLEVSGRCPATADVVSFPDDNCYWLPTSLKELHISDFVSLESVSMGLQRLTSLEKLSITNCPKLQCLPKDALPYSLNEVSIKGCRLLRAHYLENRGEYSSMVHVSDR